MIGGATWRFMIVASVLSASGCDLLFQLDHVERRDAAVSDANDGDAETLSCASPIFADTFAGPEYCAWGSPYMDPGATIEANGQLVVTPGKSGASVAGCISTSNRAFGSGVTAIVNEIVRGNDAYTVLSARGTNLQIKGSSDGTLRFQTAQSADIGNVVTYDANKTWWRIRPMGASTIVGEYSNNGIDWHELGRAGQGVPATIGFELTCGTNTAGVTGQCLFDLLEICP